ncbi:hypothetical protein ABPG74_013119 [Tetrahymena malaccensis]
MVKNHESCERIDLIQVMDEVNLIGLIKMNALNSMTMRELLIARNRNFLSNNQVLIVNSSIEDHSKAPLNKISKREEMAINAQIIKQINSNYSDLKIYFLRDLSKALPINLLQQICETLLQIFEKGLEKIVSSK